MSRTVLPRVIRDFGTLHPGVRFTLKQGDYTRTLSGCTTAWWIFALRRAGLPQAREACGLSRRVGGAAAGCASAGGKGKGDARRPGVRAFVLLDEGEQSLVLDAFATHGLSPHVTSEVTDDYTIMAMVEEGLGVSMLYPSYCGGPCEPIFGVRPIVHAPRAT